MTKSTPSKKQIIDVSELKLTSPHYARDFWRVFNEIHVEMNLEQLKKETLKYYHYDKSIHAPLAKIDKVYFATVGKVFYILNHQGELDRHMVKTAQRMITEIVSGDKRETMLEPPVEEVDSKPSKREERYYEKIDAVVGVFDTWVDDYLDGKIGNLLDCDIQSVLLSNNINIIHARYLKTHYDNAIEELTMVLSGECPDLSEGYQHHGRVKIKRMIKFYENVSEHMVQLVEDSNNRSLRKKKPNELVSKLKYKIYDDKLDVNSVNPVHIIGAKCIFFYNTKTRKIGRYVAKDKEGLTVKSTKIHQFDEVLSIERTLGKPLDHKDIFKEKDADKIMAFIDNLTTIDTKLTGRMNEHVLLFKCVK